MIDECAVLETDPLTNHNSSEGSGGFNSTEGSGNGTATRNRRSLFQPIQGTQTQRQDPLLEQLDLRELTTVMEAELGCLERMAVKMRQVPDEICYLNKYEIAHQGNDLCWTGSTFGR